MAKDPLSEEEIFARAREIDPPERREHYVAEKCGEDSQMRTRIQIRLRDLDRQHPADAEDLTLDSPVPAPLDATRDSESNVRRPVDPSFSVVPGTMIAGRYELLESIGQGGMGSVWLAQQSDPVQRKVAIKLIKPGMDSQQVLARFDAERQALARMEHPNIAKVFDGGLTDQGRPFFVMEYVRGTPLTEYCDQAKLSINQRLELFVVICHAVQHAHQKGIIHRDLKPSNILVSGNQDQPEPKVIDFGLAKAVSENVTDQTQVTAVGMVLGTPLYMSPEQAESNNLDIDTRADIYSLGVLLYELLTGTTPLDKDIMKKAAVNEVLRIVREVDPPKPSSRVSFGGGQPGISGVRGSSPTHLTKTLTGDLDWIVMKSIEKDRDRRYATASGLAADILRHLKSEPVVAGPPSLKYRMTKFVQRNRAGVIAASLIVLSLFLGIAGTSLGMIWAKQKEAIAKSALAEKELALQETRKTIDNYVSTVQNAELLKEQRFKPLLKELLSSALEHYELFVDQHDHNEEQLADLANALGGVSQISLMSGDVEKAIEAGKKSTVLREQLVNQYPQRDDYREALGKGFGELGGLYASTGRIDEALVAGNKGLRIFEKALEEDPANAKYQHDLALIHMSLAKLHGSSDQPDTAVDFYESAIALQEKLVEQFPEQSDYLTDVANGHFELGNFHKSKGNLQPALAAYQKASQILEDPDKPQPSDLKLLHHIASIHSNMGRIYEQTGQPEKALDAYHQSIEIAEKLVEENPTVTEFQSGLSVNYHNISYLYQSMGDLDKALESYETLIEQSGRLVKENPTVVEYRGSLAKDLHNMGFLHQTMGNPEQAIAAYKSSLEIRQRLVDEHPRMTDYQNDLAESFINIGHTNYSNSQPEDALASFQRALEIQSKLVEDFPAVTLYKNNIGLIYNNIGLAQQSLGHPVEALDSYKKSLEVLEKVLEENPDSVEQAINLAGNYINTANLAQTNDEFIESTHYYGLGIKTLGKVLENNPGNPQAKLYMKNGHMGHALLLQKQDKFDEAVIEWEHAIEFDDGSMKAALESTRDTAATKAKSQPQKDE